MKQKEFWNIGFLILVGVISGSIILSKGYPVAGDVWPHLVRTEIVYELLKQGEYPAWTFFFYSGYPFLRFYSPLYYFLSAILTFLFLNPFTANKVLLFGLHIFSGLTIYLLAKKLFKDSLTALISASTYLLTFWHLAMVIGLGRYTAALIFLFLPLSFYSLLKLKENPTIFQATLSGIVFSSLPLSHIFYATFAGILLICFAVLPSFRSRFFFFFLISLIIGLGISTFFTIPFFIEGPRNRLPSPPTILPEPSLPVLIGIKKGVGGYTGTYLGLSLLILASLGFIRLLKERSFYKSPIFWGLFLSLIPTFGTRIPVVQLVATIGEPQRFLVFVTVFLSLFAGEGFLLLKSKLKSASGEQNARLFFLVFLVTALDLFPHLFQPPYQKPEDFLLTRTEIYGILSQKENYRLLDIDIPTKGIDIFRRIARYPATGFLFSNKPSVLGPPYHQFAPRCMFYVYPWVDYLAQDLGDSLTQDLSEKSAKILRLLDIRYLVSLPTLLGVRDNQTLFFLKNGLLWDDRLLVSERKPPYAIGLDTTQTPIIASNVIRPWREKTSLVKSGSFYIADNWEEYLDSIRFISSKVCKVLYIRDGEAESLANQVKEVKILEYDLEHQVVKIRFFLSDEAFVRVAFSYYPEIEIFLNEKPVKIMETLDHYLLIKAQSGVNNLIIKPRLTKLRVLTFWISGGFIILSLVLLVFFYPRRRILKIGD